MRKSSQTKTKTQKKPAAKKSAQKTFKAYGVISKPSKPTKPSKRSPAPGFSRNAGGLLLVPDLRSSKQAEPGVVSASKLQKGIAKAREQISGVLQELLDATRDGYEVTEIELSASFSADGKFLGFGVGGEMSIKFKVRPIDEA
jgi:hypothetical protein